MTDHPPDTSDTLSKAEAVADDTLLTDLMQTRMLPGENPNAFQRLSARVIAHVQPRGGLEELLILDYLHYSWEALRLRRYKDYILLTRARDGIVPVLEPLLEDGADGAEYMAGEWSPGVGGAPEIEGVLADAGLTLDAPMAQTLALNIDLFQQLDWLLEGAERRRAASLRELDHQRSALARRAREAMREIEEADYRVLPDLAPVGGDARLKRL
jgi:hypothetical protein